MGVIRFESRRGLGSERKRWGQASVIALVLAVGLSSPSFASLLSDKGTSQMSSDFKTENRFFEGEYPEEWRWKGHFCDDYLWTQTKVNFRIGDATDFELNDDGTVEVYADLYDANLHVYALYKSGYTLCNEIGGWMGVRADRVQIRARLYLPEDENADITQVKVAILGTKFGTIHMGKGVPHWFENWATYVANRAVVHVWKSKLGGWIADKFGHGMARYLSVGQ